jgi:hypothetical protein
MPLNAIQVCSLDESMTRLKKVVYSKRIRVKEFLSDFDRLRSGVLHENHFISGLSIAGLDKQLSPQQIGTIVDAYRVQVTPSMSMIDWVSFVEDVEHIFTTKACFPAQWLVGFEETQGLGTPSASLCLLVSSRCKCT